MKTLLVCHWISQFQPDQGSLDSEMAKDIVRLAAQCIEFDLEEDFSVKTIWSLGSSLNKQVLNQALSCHPELIVVGWQRVQTGSKITMRSLDKNTKRWFSLVWQSVLTWLQANNSSSRVAYVVVETDDQGQTITKVASPQLNS
ncbi:MAG: hypothetical protein ABIH67_02225 [Candidatus Uhrbacteria bacterium]